MNTEKQTRLAQGSSKKQKVLVVASVASMILQFNMPNIRMLLEMGYEVHVACNLKEGNTCSRRQVQEFQAGLQRMQVALYQWDCPRSAYALGRCLRAYRQLWGLTGRNSYAWIHCHSPVGGALARLVAHRRGIKTIYTAHGFHFYKGAPWKNWLLYYPVEKLLSYWTDVLVTVNREDARLARQHFHACRQCRIPGAGVDIGKFQAGVWDDVLGAAGQDAPGQQARALEQAACKAAAQGCTRKGSGAILRRKLGIPGTAVLLLSVGELSRRKNHTAILRILAEFPEREVYYLICGQGPLRKKLVRQARRYRIAGRICMPGYMEDIRMAYQAADIFVFPSKQEGLPVALIEAMAAGLPCIVSDIRGNRELIPSGECRFAPGHPRQMRGMLVRLIEDAGLRKYYGRCNQDRVCAYGLQDVQRKMGRIYCWMGEDRKTKRKK